jgi:hypothetical protein
MKSKKEICRAGGESVTHPFIRFAKQSMGNRTKDFQAGRIDMSTLGRDNSINVIAFRKG